MFVFVIIGLSFVSMLLSVIQIKMEEWLYRMMIKMHVRFYPIRSWENVKKAMFKEYEAQFISGGETIQFSVDFDDIRKLYNQILDYPISLAPNPLF